MITIFKKLFLKILVSVAKPTILFESIPDFSDNTFAVYKKMCAQGIDRDYYFCWIKTDGSYIYFQHGKQIEIGNNKALPHFIRTISLYKKTKLVISCQRFLPIYFKSIGAVLFYLTHGTPIKNTRSYFTVPTYYDFVLCQGNGVKDSLMYSYDIPEEKIVTLGFPRNDVLCKKTNIDLRLLFNNRFKKIIAWYPTFRQHKSESTPRLHCSIPIIHIEQNFLALNNFAKNNNVLIIIKLHIAQDESYIKCMNLENIIFIDDIFFKNKGISSYEFISNCDALLTDYSSVYYDFLLCNKPIGLVWEDYDEYKEYPGFCVDTNYMMCGGYKIYDLHDLEFFIFNITCERDFLKEQRETIRDCVNYSTDGHSTERVIHFVMESIKE